ncbi:MAG: hypothetical protein LKH74_02750 [Levilactobacillus sp.]|jgi:hypothetical protein|uniref:hypothetical protein n=1 Tax=Levilactobacillus sp. TaxID=2767919 RepID=UPI002587826A|nr:hypothetical protein [Levilactobacillus sp.]MCH4124400.1 hypothetical protein [Levilactobacillus sp.]MCI1552830.1 hypothetical protein [Levilactobacillus sp.]MCI1605486.1 hypothetical protein [Levilactobacillus sp.]
MTLEPQEIKRVLDIEEALYTPISEKNRQLIDEFLEIRQAYRSVTRRIEDALQAPLDHYQQRRHFYLDVADLAHFRLNFFELVGHFLQKTVGLTYRLELWDRESHHKDNFSDLELTQAACREFSTGTAVETLEYAHLNFRLRRKFEIRGRHLYWEKSQFFVAGREVPLTDGLMQLQHELEACAPVLRGTVLKIKEFT